MTLDEVKKRAEAISQQEREMDELLQRTIETDELKFMDNVEGYCGQTMEV